MAFTIYRSTDSSAPVLTGQTGTLVTVLDAVLVNGYGAKPAAGWAKTFSGTSKAVYRPGAGNRFYLRVQDDGPGVGSFREARITGYETVSDVDTGLSPFPTAAQGVGGIAMVIARKSSTLDATARAWMAVADDRTLYFFALTGDTANVYHAFAFGDFYSLIPSDAFRTFIVGRIAENSGIATNDRLDTLVASPVSTANIYLARGHTGLGGSVHGGKHGDSAKGGGSGVLNGVVPFTNPTDGGAYLARVWIHDPTTAPAGGIRGRFRGLWHFCHAIASVNDGDTISGTGTLSGKTFLFIKQSGNAGLYTIETSNTLETN
jgi:hypothetical protein